MEFFKHNTNIDFMGARKWAALFSLLLFALSIIGLYVNGLQFGLDFTGGAQIEVTYAKPADLNTIRAALDKNGLGNSQVQNYGSLESVLITMALPKNGQGQEVANDKNQQKIRDQITSILPGAQVQRVDYVGPQLGKELAMNGALALVVAMLGTMIYIMMRFEYRFAVSSTAALIHDPILILGIFAWLHVEFDVNALGALLAVIGYSLNDTIVVFDRVRENFRKVRKGTPSDVVNLSVNQTLSRTLMTSGTSLMILIVLFFFGGTMIHSFALALIIGIVVGTYSSIYVAGALALAMGLNKTDLMPSVKTVVDDMP